MLRDVSSGTGEAQWRRLSSHDLITDLISGTQFKNGLNEIAA